ncbi:MAG: MoxR family ATPase [Eubacteriales bacterium]|nr:MoxR family ATPase [Eubacteriales bacterium]
MNIDRAKQEIKNTLHAYFSKDENGEYAINRLRQRPILLIGAPGIGKTQIMEQIANEEQVALVSYTLTHHTRQSAIGLPFIEKKIYSENEYSVTEYTMSEIIASVYEEMERTGMENGILFLDEINCVSETLAPTMLQFLQAKTFGTHKLPDGWLIVAAGNPPEYNKSVRDFDVATLDRIRKINVQPDFEAWKLYALKKLIHPAIIAYLTIKPQYFCKIETTVDGRFFATPRGWEDLSELIYSYEKLGIEIDRDIIAEYIQFPDISKDFANYLELYYKYENRYKAERILSGIIDEKLCDELKKARFDEKLSVISILISVLGKDAKKIWQRARQLEGMKLEFEHIAKEEKEEFKTYFYELSDDYESLFEALGKKLEYAFDFMEAAFENGQEIIFFMTLLNESAYILDFLKEYDCERYYEYNKKLLFEDEEDAILKKGEKIFG